MCLLWLFFCGHVLFDNGAKALKPVGSVLLLLHSQSCLLGSQLWQDFCVCDRFQSNLRLEVVTFDLHGGFMLGVLLLPSFTHLGHECQEFLSLCDGMHVCTD